MNRSSSSGLYVYPALGGIHDFGFFRIGGPGLANMLLSWARSVVAAKRLDATLLTPAWFSPKIGPLLRGEADKRMYLGIFQQDGVSLGGAMKLLSFLSVRRRIRFVNPLEIQPGPKGTLYSPDPHVIAPYYFSGLFDYHSMISKLLLDMIIDRHVNRVKDLGRPQVAVHVRLGDFVPAVDGITGANRQLPLEWYVDRMTALRSELGSDTHFTIFSDGRPDQIKSILEFPNAELRRGENAIVDLLSMARAQALIASASTFSLWAAFLGRMPSIWHPGGLLQVFPNDYCVRLESATGSPIASHFINAVRLFSPQFEENLSSRSSL